MLKVMLVDDEPFILQGLEVLIDWEAEGFSLVKLAENGQEALDFLRENPVDLIFADIKMPVMDGLTLLKTVRGEAISDAIFVFLSGYNEFLYAQTALRYGCMDYILKPVQKETMLELLAKVRKQKASSTSDRIMRQELQENRIERLLVSVLQGKDEQKDLKEIAAWLQVTGPVRYVHIGIDIVRAEDELADEELRERRQNVLESCRKFLGEYGKRCFRDMIGYERDYEVALIYDGSLAVAAGQLEQVFFQQLHREIQKKLDLPVYLLVGKQVEDLSRLGHSYSTACMLRSFIGFREEKGIYFYEEEIQAERSVTVLCKKNLDQLVEAVKNNQRVKINRSLDALYDELELSGMETHVVNMNINYLLFQLINLAVDLDETVNQEEIMQRISESVFENQADRGSRRAVRRFVCEYAEYLNQLRKHAAGGVLREVEREIRENYAENLTLKSLSQKYYINSSYLGQMFRKQYGQSFRDYLSAYRISKAEYLLLHTDKKIAAIAEEVGYRDLDYFINRFIALKGVTPARFRRSREE